MKHILTLCLLCTIAIASTAQKVVKPKNNTVDTFTLIIDGVPYQEYVLNHLQKPQYKKAWEALVQKNIAQKKAALNETAITATIRLLVSVDHKGNVYIEIHNPISSNEDVVSAEEILNLMTLIRNDLRKLAKKKTIATPAYSTYHNHYVNDEREVSTIWQIDL